MGIKGPLTGGAMTRLFKSPNLEKVCFGLRQRVHACTQRISGCDHLDLLLNLIGWRTR